MYTLDKILKCNLSFAFTANVKKLQGWRGEVEETAGRVESIQ